MPDYIFETSWEVCNHVGGIHTVLSSRAALMQSLNKDHIIFFGPDLKERSDLEFREDRRILRKWRELTGRDKNLPKVRVGRWNISDSPIAVLVDYSHLWADKDTIYGWAWEQFGVQSHAAYGDYDDSCLFGYAVGQAMKSLYEWLSPQENKKTFVAHSNEWQTGFTVFYLRAFCPAVRTLFTTHATGIGRSIAGNGKPLYDCFTAYNGDQMAQELNMVSKHSAEKQAAHHCHCFTTVSDLTARECTQLLEKTPDIVTPNGFELCSVPQGKAFTARRNKTRQVLTGLYRHLLRLDNTPANPVFVAISGRLEWKNKGIDVFLQAMERLADGQIDRPVVAFVLIPYLDKACWTKGNVTVVFLPFYLPLNEKENYDNISQQHIDRAALQPLMGMTYYDLLIGMDMTVFPSYYEPWGYTPMESVAYHIPTVTTDLAGYGIWAKQASGESGFPPVTVIHRTDENSEDVIGRITSTVRSFISLGNNSVEAIRKAAAQLAKKSTWEHFFACYEKAYRIALSK